MSETNELKKRKTSELTEQTSPSTSAKLVGVDNGETVQVPTSFFQEQIDELKKDVEGKAESTHGHSYNDLTDKPTIPSVAGLASETYVNEKVAGVVNSAPATLDTLNELSKALGNDPNFATTVATQIGNKVDKVSGKGLSTNDYTTAEKNKLAGLSTVATSGSYNDLKDKPSIPSAYSHPASHPASMITGLAKVATSGSYNDLTDKPTIPSTEGLATEKYVDEKVSSMSGGSPSGGGGIIDVAEFPSNPSTTAIYREWQVCKAEWLYCGEIVTDGGMTCEVVDTLPETGNICYTGTSVYSYYQKADGEVYGYVDSGLSAMMSVPVGWYPAATLFGALGYVYNGLIDKIADAGDSGYCILLTKKPFLYCFHNNGSTIEKSVIITSNNFEFDEATGTLVLEL